MNTVDRYIGIKLGQAFVLVMLALLPMFSFLDLIQQLDDVGKGDYGIFDALLFEWEMLPRRGLDLLPFAALMSCTIALALLAHHSELIAMQAAGMSIARIGWAVVKSGIILMGLAALLEEFVASPLHQHTVQERSAAISGSPVAQREGGFWIHYRDRFVNIDRLLYGRIPADIEIFELGPERRLENYMEAAQADISDPERWLLEDLLVKKLEGGRLVTQQLPELRWKSYLTAEQIRLLEIPPAAMSPSQSYRYVRYLKDTGQEADRYELALWQKLTLPLATGAMILLAIPFAFGLPRLVSIGKRIGLALGSGLAFQIVNQIVANLGLIMGLSAPLITLLPIIIAFGFAFFLLRRVQQQA
jgi:lipopolysaccharide export system permease protein